MKRFIPRYSNPVAYSLDPAAWPGVAARPWPASIGERTYIADGQLKSLMLSPTLKTAGLYPGTLSASALGILMSITWDEAARMVTISQEGNHQPAHRKQYPAVDSRAM